MDMPTPAPTASPSVSPFASAWHKAEGGRLNEACGWASGAVPACDDAVRLGYHHRPGMGGLRVVELPGGAAMQLGALDYFGGACDAEGELDFGEPWSWENSKGDQYSHSVTIIG